MKHHLNSPGYWSRLHRIVGAGILATLASASLPTSALAQRSLVIEEFHSTIQVEQNGGIRVRESVSPRFTGSWNGIYRTIPVEYRTPTSGFSYRLLLDVESVTDEAGRSLRHEVSRQGPYRKIKVWVPDARDATRTVHIRYSVPNALRFFEEDAEFAQGHDELYWNVTGDEWEIPIESASAEVRLPDGITGLRADAWTGGYGSTGRAVVIQDLDDGFYFRATQPLRSREGLTIAVAWDPGVVARPGWLARTRWFLYGNWMLLLPLVSLGIMCRLWSTRGRDPARRPVSPQYQPPEGLSPGEVGTLVDNRPDIHDLTASVVDLAVRGYLRIEEEEKSKLLGLFSDTDYRFVRLRAPDTDGLHTHERRILDALFKNGASDSVYLSDLQNEFYRSLSDIRNGIYDRLVELGYYARRPDKVLTRYMILGVAVLGLGIALGLFLASRLTLSPVTAVLAAVLAAFPVFVFGAFMPARTVMGTRVLERVLGFQEFMNRVDSDRFRRMITSPEMFEAFLPFAMALKVEKKWARAFEGIFKQQPDWYVGRDPTSFTTTRFVGDLSAMSVKTGSTMTSQPRSSGGSGFGGGGGGFSGGGFGGGGGGGF